MRWHFDKIEKWVWYVFLATLAWQTRLILWQADRVFVEWRSISFYLTDAPLLVLLVLALAQSFRPKIDRRDSILLLFLFVALISLRSTDQITVSVYQWFRLAEFIAFYVYIRYWAVKRFDADTSLVAFVAGALLQSGLAITQYALQHDAGLRWMGETLLNTHLPGVAVFYDSAHIKILRAYGTLPHPNVLAVYLMTALWGLMYLYLRHAQDHVRHHRWIWAVSGALLLYAFYLTFSRTMIAVWLAATAAFAGVLLLNRFSASWPNIQTIRYRVRHILIALGIASAVFVGVFWRQVAARAVISGQEEAVTLRVYYAKEALRSGAHNLLNLNWTGIGIGNFVSWLYRADPSHPLWMYQPAHDLYLLVYSETGILGIGLFLAWLTLLVRAAIASRGRPPLVRWGLVMVLGAFLTVAIFDHFFWTLQQGQILFWLVAALV